MSHIAIRTAWFLLSFMIIALDYVTKSMAIKHLLPYQPKLISSFFSLTLAYNTGAAFSFLSDLGAWHRWFFAGFSLIMSFFISIWLIRLPDTSRAQSLALSLILGGAVGNLYDRFMYGYVIDFLDLHYMDHHWPVFNVADSCICLGAGFLFLELFSSKDAI